MARGTVVGEPVVSQARTKEFEEGYDRIFGPDRKAERGRWVWDELQQKLVKSEDYVPPSRAVDAPIMVDRFYEGAKATDGSDIGSRRKHRAYMKAHGLTTVDDYSTTWAKAEQRRQEFKAGKRRDPRLRETLERAFYDIDKRSR